MADNNSKSVANEAAGSGMLVVSFSPHVHSGAKVRCIMLDVLVALIPALIAAVYFFHWNAVRLVLTCVVSSVLTEVVCRRLMGRDAGIGDFSAVVTGVLLAFNLPPDLMTWKAALGSVFAIAIAKQVFGGIGYNPFNPALIGRVFLLVSFTQEMLSWSGWQAAGMQEITTASPLGIARMTVAAGKPLPFTFDAATAWQFFVGNTNGCIGEVSELALLIGGIYLLWRRCIYWQTPVFYIGTVALFALILRIVDPAHSVPVPFHLLSGGLVLGALFMATDMVTTPVTKSGMIVFGVGCGLITMLIRTWGGYPEGVSFSILIMNAITPLINRATRPTVFGQRKKK